MQSQFSPCPAAEGANRRAEGKIKKGQRVGDGELVGKHAQNSQQSRMVLKTAISCSAQWSVVVGAPERKYENSIPTTAIPAQRTKKGGRARKHRLFRNLLG